MTAQERAAAVLTVDRTVERGFFDEGDAFEMLGNILQPTHRITEDDFGALA